MKMISNRAIWDVLIDKEEFPAAPWSAAIEGDQILVSQAGEDLNFVFELFKSFVVVLVQALNCNFPSIFESS